MRAPNLCYIMQPNARLQALGIAGAKNERRLLPVACKPLFGPAAPPTLGLPGPLALRRPLRRATLGWGTRAAMTSAHAGDTLAQA